jgi:acetyl esterase/lipase
VSLDAQTQALIEQMKQGGFKPANQIPIEISRTALTQMAITMAAPKADVFASEDRNIAGPGGDLPIRVYRHAAKINGQTSPVVIFFHGGGMYLGDLETHDHVCRYICKHAGMTVIAVEYRLAPENKYPAGLEDCYAALCWVAENGNEIGVDPDQIALVGDSAGGTLAVSCCLLAKQKGGPAIAYQVVVYPALTMTDGEEFPSRAELGTGEYFISLDDFAFFRDLYLNDEEKEVRDPLVSPIYADNYRDLPPALVIAAGYDPCLDENKLYADRLAADGVPVTYKCFENTIHPFFLFDGVIDAGKEGQKLVSDTLRDFFGTK